VSGWRPIAAFAVVVLLAGCGRGDNHGTASGADSSELERDKTIALTQPVFSSEITLHINPDDADTIADVDAHVSNPYPFQSSAPLYPCHADYGANAPDLWASIDGDNGSLNHVLGGWLLQSGWIQTSTHSLSFMGNGGVQSESFVCHLVTKVRLRFLQGAMDDMDIHHGLTIPLFMRACTRWTYANAYEVETPGKGKVKVFAGTFDFRLMPLVPGITTQGGGTYSVKMLLDPDTGKWESTFQKTSDTGTISWAPITPTSPFPNPPAPDKCG
jgi:hypothetical protein